MIALLKKIYISKPYNIKKLKYIIGTNLLIIT